LKKTERSKLVEGIYIALRGCGGVEMFCPHVFQFLHRSSDVEQDNWGGGSQFEGFPEANQGRGVLPLCK